ncbi:MAG: polyribonucleotide nucleotidyltransferase [Candidatus Kaelpia aquatica]|nr:polyribonucleotide nucleotidyltransferase [Candidatus Kaelpia aquatica]
MMKEEVRVKIGEEDIIITTGEMAKQANGSVKVQCGDTVVLVNAVMSAEVREGIDFLPLMVDYRERTYAAGKIPGGFFKREGRPTDKEILTSRLIDRPIRPLFPEGLRNEVQIVAIVLSSDGKYDPDVLAVIGASAALYISDIPFESPIAGIKLAMVDGEFIISPDYKQVEDSDLTITLIGDKDGIIMLEGEAREMSEEDVFNAISFAQKYFPSIVDAQNELRKKCGKEKFKPELFKISSDTLDAIRKDAGVKIAEISIIKDKEERASLFSSLKSELIEKYQEVYSVGDIKEAIHVIQKSSIREYAIKNKKRVDGRSLNELRDISCSVGVLPRTHGSALFTRGQTQSLAVTTLGTTSDEQTVESLEGKSSKKFMLHYNFPSFSVGEVGFMRGPGRREIGHGALAEKALRAVMPKDEDFPYTVRLVSDILESNGSSSMATVCAGSLAMMDAGVPLKSSVAGIALGLFKEGDDELILTDIAGMEDHIGDMDFKIAGTRAGITAIQVDLKITGIKLDLISKILKQSHEARIKILDVMDQVMSQAKTSVSAYAPRLTSFKLDPDKIGVLIGPGGKTIKKLVIDTGARFDVDDDGVLHIAADDDEQLQDALRRVEELIKDVEVGELYDGKVVKVMNFGAFCSIAPGKEGLVHVSELSNEYVANIEDVIKKGDEVKVKVIGIDDAGKIKLSMKQVE